MSTILHKKVKLSAKEGKEGDVAAPATPVIGAERALRSSLLRVLPQAITVLPDVVTPNLQTLSLPELLETLPTHVLPLILEEPGEGMGVLIISGSLLVAMIEVMTIGQSRAGTEARKPTRIETAMITPLVDIIMQDFEKALADHDDLSWVTGFRYISAVEDTRTLGLVLEEIPYNVMDTTVSFTSGISANTHVSEGKIWLALPAPKDEPDQQSTSEEAQLADLFAENLPSYSPNNPFARALSANVALAQGELTAVIERLHMPISQAMSLSVGQVLALPNARIDQIALEDTNGKIVAQAKLGQHHNMRALRLNIHKKSTQIVFEDALSQWEKDQQQHVSPAKEKGATHNTVVERSA